jgi:hypothetical protein
VVLMYDPRELPGVTTARHRVVGVLQMVSEPTLAVSRARTGQLTRIRWRTGQGHGMVRMLLIGRTVCVLFCAAASEGD